MQKASHSLFVSQQAISRMLKNLEDELGVSLFIRDSHGVTPTDYGVLLMRETEDLVAQIDTLSYRIKSRTQAISGSIHIGTLIGHMGSMSRLNIVALDRCRSFYPSIDLYHMNAGPNEIEKSILDGQLDFGFSAFPSVPEEFECRKLFDFKWYMAMSHDHPLANHSVLGIDDLKRQLLVFPKKEQFDRLQIMRALPSSAQPKFIDASFSLYDTVFQQVLPLKAMMLCAEPHAPLLNPAVVRLVPFHTNLLRSQIYLLIKKGIPLSDAARQVLDFLLAAWQFPSLEEL